MSTAIIKYTGSYQTECMHVRSGKTVETDPPLDNQGLGEAFSPTDLLATSLGACMLTIFAQAAQARSIDIGNPSLEVTKVMSAEAPRRVAEIHVGFHVYQNVAESDQAVLERAALACPVAKSLHPDLKQITTFHWN
jgi:uncharacterized OsmC-like protein